MEPNRELKVYVTRGGSRYHFTLACEGLSSGQLGSAQYGYRTYQPEAVTREEAIQRGLGRCQKCW